MGSWVGHDELNAMWEEFAKKNWQEGESVRADTYSDTKKCWHDGYKKGFELEQENKDGNALQG